MRILITSGGTKVPIDDVRFIGNMSSGKYGALLCEDFSRLGIGVSFLCAKGSKISEYHQIGIYNGDISSSIHYFNDFDSYKDTAITLVDKNKFDIIISAAAVSDYVMDKTVGKISSDDELVLRLKKAPKILPLLKETSPNSVIVGFKLLVSPTEEQKLTAIKKVLASGADMVVYNDLTEIRKGYTKRFLYDSSMSETVCDTSSALAINILDQYNKIKK